MKKKISIDKTLQDIVYINNQISGLKMLLDSKKKIMEKFFEKTGEKKVSNDECTVFVQERPTIDYDIGAIIKKLGKKKAYEFIDREYKVRDWKQFSKWLKSHDLELDQVKPFLHVEKKVNQDKLSKLYERGTITLKQLDGCYTARVTKSVVLRMTNIDREILIKPDARQ